MKKPIAVKDRESDAGQEAYIDAREALAMLGVKPQTFYAYVSRGLIRAAPSSDAKRHTYYRSDVIAATAKSRNRQASGSAAEHSLKWKGAAVMHTSITFISPQGPVYRGHPAIEMARAGRTFEECAELLWNGVLPGKPPVWPPAHVPPTFAAFADALGEVATQNTSRQLLALTADAYIACVGRNAMHELPGQELAARQLIQLMASAFGLLHVKPQCLPSVAAEPIAAILAKACGIATTEEVLMGLNACLVVAADHELTPSTFVARIAASAGADVMSCIVSALGSFEAQQNGVGCDECEEAFLKMPILKSYVAAQEKILTQKKQVAGFNHFAYPKGDPRAEYLLELAEHLGGKRVATQSMLARIAALRKALGVTPSVVSGLVAVCDALEMPQGAAGALMALGRSAGWVAHAFEQRLTGFVVRPRSRYIGSTTPSR